MLCLTEQGWASRAVNALNRSSVKPDEKNLALMVMLALKGIFVPIKMFTDMSVVLTRLHSLRLRSY